MKEVHAENLVGDTPTLEVNLSQIESNQGDLNEDGMISVEDIVLILNIILS